MSGASVCERCERRTWLLGRLAGHLDPVRARIGELLELPDAQLIEAVAGPERDAVRRELAGLEHAALGAARTRAGIEAVCRCHPGYPAALLDLPAPPAALHMAADAPGPTGGLARLTGLVAERPVAIVGARRASTYGLEVARTLAADLTAAGLTVVSGMALGIDGAAHAGALVAGGATIAVLPAGAERASPSSHARMYARIRAHGVAVSELGPGVGARRWMYPARNRIIAALAAMTILVQARGGSGALLTVAWARRLDRLVGAVPGRVGAPLSAGPHGALRDGATLVAGPQDVLDALYGTGAVPLARRRRETLDPELAALLDALAEGEEGEAALARAGLAGGDGLAALAALELAGLVRRGAGGRYTVLR